MKKADLERIDANNGQYNNNLFKKFTEKEFKLEKPTVKD